MKTKTKFRVDPCIAPPPTAGKEIPDKNTGTSHTLLTIVLNLQRLGFLLVNLPATQSPVRWLGNRPDTDAITVQ